jgi:hypothetical protein
MLEITQKTIDPEHYQVCMLQPLQFKTSLTSLHDNLKKQSLKDKIRGKNQVNFKNDSDKYLCICQHDNDCIL